MRIAIAGASGLIGSALSRYLIERGHAVHALKRGEVDLEGYDILVNLAGESIAQRWTEKTKKEIKRSRIEITNKLSAAAASLKKPMRAIINASAIGYYGDSGEQVVNENSPAGNNFLAEVTEEWEQALQPAEMQGIRTVKLRFGMVLSPQGGALATMLTPFKWGVGGVVGSGRQFMSWIAIEDLVRIIEYVIHNDYAGPINVVAPYPVRNEEFVAILGKILKRPTFLPLPEVAVKLIFGQMGQELLLASTRVEPRKLLEFGYSYMYPSLEQALRAQLIAKG